MPSVLRVSIIGALPSGEAWSVNPTYRPGGDDLPVAYDDLLAIATAIDALTVPAGVNGMRSVATTITGCRVESRDAAGALENVAEHARSSNVAGTGVGAHQHTTALVSSLRTTAAGASGRGRLYWPATGINISPSTLRVQSADLTAALGGIKQYLLDIRGAIRTNKPLAELVVWSRAQQDLRNVTRIQAGDVLDVQRRRRDALVESTQVATWP